MRKTLKRFTFFAIILAFAAALTACGLIGGAVTQLTAPSNLTAQDGVLRWNSVSNANQYVVNLDGLDIAVISEIYFNLENLTVGETYIYKVKARNSLGLYSDSQYSKEFTYEHISKEEESGGEKGDLSPIFAPSDIEINNGVISWRSVDNAVSYRVSVNGTEYISDINELSLESLKDGVYKIKVKAVGDGERFGNSDFCEEVSVDLYDGSVCSTEYFSQFDDLNQFESFLGYGFDVISDSVVCDRTVLTSFPIFDVNELMNLRFLKVNSKASNMTVISESSMVSFSQKWNSALNVNVSASGSFSQLSLGGSMKLSNEFSTESSAVKSSHYYCITISDQKFYIIMQGDMPTYRTMLSDGFKKDLYDTNVDPRILFQRYGTHFITSAVMGGRMNAFYNMYSLDEKTSMESYSKCASTITGGFTGLFGGKTSTDFSTSVENSFRESNIISKQSVNVMGGGDFGIATLEQVPQKYGDWQKSLDAYPSLMGIKDSSSLIGIWELIDRDIDTQSQYTWVTSEGEQRHGTRSEQLQSYFYDYGVENYDKLMRATSLSEIVKPNSIEDVLVSGQPINSDGYYYVNANSTNPISFTVLPGNALGYTKTYSIDDDTYAYFEDGNLKIRSATVIPSGTILNVTLGAGEIRKTIKIKIIKTYDAEFNLNFDTDYQVAIKQGIMEGGLLAEPAVMYKMIDGSIVERDCPIERYGYRLTGWSRYINGEYVRYDFSQPVSDNLVLFAQWSKIINEVRFDMAYGNSPVNSVGVDYGRTVEKPDEPIRDHYTFAGWHTERKGSLTPFDFSTPIQKKMTLYAYWTPISYTVTLHPNGGSLLESTVVTDITKNFLITTGSPIRQEYDFLGWALTNNGEPINLSLYMFKADTELYAVYTPTPITVEFDTDGGTEISDRITSVEFNYLLNEEITIPEKTGYDLVGWYVYDAESNKKSINIDLYEFRRNTVVHAEWTSKKYEVAFETNGGSGIIPYTAIEYGSNINAPSDPIKDDFIFEGWYTDEDLTERFKFSEEVVKNSFTLYAKWAKEIFNVEFVTNALEYKLDSIKVEKWSKLGKSYTTALRDVREGFMFVGWYKDKELTLNFPDSEAVVENMTLYAKWSLLSYQIVWSYGEGEKTTEKYLYGEEITVPQNPQKEGHTFDGWSEEPPSTMPARNLEFNAKWIVNVYEIGFYADEDSLLPIEIKSFDYGESVQLIPPVPPLRDGYVFIDWSAIPKTMPAENIRTVAQWEVLKYKARFYLTDSADYTIEPYHTASLAFGTELDSVYPSNPSDDSVFTEGYFFAGWNSGIHTFMPATDIDVFAIWERQTVKLTLKYGEESLTINNAKFGENLSIYTSKINLTSKGLIFNGKWLDENGAETITIPARESIVFTASSSSDSSTIELLESITVKDNSGKDDYRLIDVSMADFKGSNTEVLDTECGSVEFKVTGNCNQDILLEVRGMDDPYYIYYSHKTGKSGNSIDFNFEFVVPYTLMREKGVSLKLIETYASIYPKSIITQNVKIEASFKRNYCVAMVMNEAPDTGSRYVVYQFDTPEAANTVNYYTPQKTNYNFDCWTVNENNSPVGKVDNKFNFRDLFVNLNKRSLTVKGDFYKSEYRLTGSPSSLEIDGKTWFVNEARNRTQVANRAKTTKVLSEEIYKTAQASGYTKVNIKIIFNYSHINDCYKLVYGYFNGNMVYSNEIGGSDGDTGSITMDFGTYDISQARYEVRLEIGAAGKDKANKWAANNIMFIYKFS